MADYEVERERIVEREVPVTGRRVVVERRGGAGFGFNPMVAIVAVLVVVVFLFLLLGGVR